MEKEDDSEDSSSTKTTAKTVVDGGWGWMVVFGAFMINVITDGCSYSFGVLFTHLVDYFQANRSSTAWVGSVFNAAPLLFGPFASIIAKRFGFRIATIAGGLIAAIGIFASVFANSLGLLSFTYGFIAGFGISLPYLASSVVVMMYFEKRRSLATGLAECGAGIGTLIFAPLLQYFITEYGWRGSLLVLSAIVSNIVLCGALFRPQPILKNSRIEISIQQDLEAVSLPTCEERTEECVDRALEIGESKSEGALVVSSIGIVHTIGNVVFGFLGDCKRVNRSILYSVSMWLTGLGLALVPLSRNSVSFAIFDAIYGFFVAASEALSCVIVADILGISKLSDGYGILMFLQGIANLVGPPFAGWLYDVSGSYNNTFFAAGGSIVFLGVLYAVVPIHSRFTNRKIVE
uniref:Monocarboxylate transporter 12 n=1 Tax=Magallana gigas TaxID=29159 RepID=K1RSW2_MAGGI